MRALDPRTNRKIGAEREPGVIERKRVGSEITHSIRGRKLAPSGFKPSRRIDLKPGLDWPTKECRIRPIGCRGDVRCQPVRVDQHVIVCPQNQVSIGRVYCAIASVRLTQCRLEESAHRHQRAVPANHFVRLVRAVVVHNQDLPLYTFGYSQASHLF